MFVLHSPSAMFKLGCQVGSKLPLLHLRQGAHSTDSPRNGPQMETRPLFLLFSMILYTNGELIVTPFICLNRRRKEKQKMDIYIHLNNSSSTPTMLNAFRLKGGKK